MSASCVERMKSTNHTEDGTGVFRVKYMNLFARDHQTSLTTSLFIEMHGPNQKSEQSRINMCYTYQFFLFFYDFWVGFWNFCNSVLSPSFSALATAPN